MQVQRPSMAAQTRVGVRGPGEAGEAITGSSTSNDGNPLGSAGPSRAAATGARRTRSSVRQSGNMQAGQKRRAPDGGDGPANKVLRKDNALSRRGSGGGFFEGGEGGQHSNPQWPDIKEGRQDVQTVVEALEEDHRAHRDVDERDHIGASPLHLSVLYSKSRGNKSLRQRSSSCRALGWEEREEHEQYAKGIWASEALQNLRTAQYDRGDYEGENVLHLAIGKRNGALVEFFLKHCTEQEKRKLVNGRVTGSFDIAHFTTVHGTKKEKRCRFGEHPIAWAACTNQEKVVDLLLENGAEADCKTLHEDTILHLLVRWSGWLQEDKADSGGHLDDQDEKAEWLCSMFDKILESIIDKRCGGGDDSAQCAERRRVLTWKNCDGLSPLLLASSDRVASKSLFNHLIKKNVQALWILGPYRGISMDVEAIDPVAAKLASPATRSESDDAKTVLSLLVKAQNADLISNRYIQALLDTKWETYARKELLNRLLQTLLMLGHLVEAQLIPVRHNAELLGAFGFTGDEWAFGSLQISKSLILIYFLGRVMHLIFRIGCKRMFPLQLCVDGLIALFILLELLGMCKLERVDPMQIFKMLIVIWFLCRVMHGMYQTRGERIYPCLRFDGTICLIILLLDYLDIFKIEDVLKISIPFAVSLMSPMKFFLMMMPAVFVLICGCSWPLVPENGQYPRYERVLPSALHFEFEIGWSLAHRLQLDTFKYRDWHTISFVLVCLATWASDTCMASWFLEGAPYGILQMEFSLWQTVIFLYCMPWLYVMLRPSTKGTPSKSSSVYSSAFNQGHAFKIVVGVLICILAVGLACLILHLSINLPIYVPLVPLILSFFYILKDGWFEWVTPEFVASFGVAASFAVSWWMVIECNPKDGGWCSALDGMFGDATWCGSNKLSPTDKLILIASIRTRVSSWFFLFFGVLQNSWIECKQWWAVGSDYWYSGGTLARLQNISSIASLPLLLIMCLSHFLEVWHDCDQGTAICKEFVGLEVIIRGIVVFVLLMCLGGCYVLKNDFQKGCSIVVFFLLLFICISLFFKWGTWVFEWEYPSAVLLTACLLVRLVVYLFGIQQVTRHLILLFQTSFDIVKVVCFFLLVNVSFSLVLTLDYRFRTEREGQNIADSKRNASQEFRRLLLNTPTFLVDTKDYFGGESTFEAIKARNDPWGMILGAVALIGFTTVPFILSQSLLATLMGKRGEESQEKAEAIFKMGRAMVLTSIDDELLAQDEPDQYFVYRTQDRPKPGSSEWLFQACKRDQPDEADILQSTWHEFQPDSDIVKELDHGKDEIQIETATLEESCKKHLMGQQNAPKIKIEVDYVKNVFWVLVNRQKRGAYKLWKRERGNQQYLYKDGDQPYMCHLTPKVQLNSKLDSKAYSRYMKCATHFE